MDNPTALDEVGKHYSTRTSFAVEKLMELSQKYFGGVKVCRKLIGEKKSLQ